MTTNKTTKDVADRKIKELEAWGKSTRSYQTKAGKKSYTYSTGKGIIKITDLREWAIAVVNKCHNMLGRDPYRYPCGETKKDGRCMVCEFLIDRFELKESDLR